MKLTTEIFIDRCRKIHGDKYDYSMVEYKNMKTKVKIICRNGHEFDQSPDNHLKGKGCRYCFGLVTKHSFCSFVESSIKKHGVKYDYSKVKYINNKTKVTIICPIHFEQTPNLHLSKSGCPKCYYDSLKSDNMSFILKSNIIHNDRYDYSLVDYVNNHNLVKIICKEHGVFEQTTSSHLSGSGCKECMKKSFRIKFNEFSERANKIHDNKYRYYEDEYFDLKRKIKVNCPVHGDFLIIPDNHISKGRGCSKCSNNISKLEIEWLNQLSVSVELRQKMIHIDDRLFKFDAFDPINKIIYEFYGDFWHGNINKYNYSDKNPRTKMTFGEMYDKTIEREEYLRSKGYKVISIWESDFKKINNNYGNR
jgi:hypothetical protein